MKKRTEEQNKEKKHNKLVSFFKKHKKKILFILILCILIYIVFIVANLIKNPTDTVFVEMGQIEEKETAVGYIIRDETVLKGENYKNGIEQIKTEGEKVAKGEPIFRYYSNNEESLIKKIQELDAKIDEAMTEEDNPLLGDTKLLEEQIDTKISELYRESSLTKIKDAKQTISNNMTKKAKIVGEYSPSGSYLKKLIDERSKYENELNSGAEQLTAVKSGVVSYRVDGYEDILTTDDFSKYTKEFLEDLNLKTGQIIPTSNESGKIIDNYSCYIVSVLDSDYAKDAEVGDELTLRLPSGEDVSATIEYITNQDNECVITFKIDKGVEELISYRKISFSIIWWSETGLKVPNSAISEEEQNGNKVSYVVRSRVGYEDKILVKILKSNEKYSVVTNYTTEELTEMGYSSSEIRSMPNITIYDEILINK